MFSIVIRNKNEANALEATLNILLKVYAEDIDEIIIVDNNSTDESIAVAEKFDCKIITIENFTYGKAINLGISEAKNDLILLLSAHAVPIGNSFFKNIVGAFDQYENIAGIRFINSFENYERSLKNNFQVKDGLSFGLMAACAVVNKKVWETYKFNEHLIASEDKEWSQRVINDDYKIIDLNETFFYFLKRNIRGNLKRWEIETIAHYQLHKLKYPSVVKIVFSFFFKIGYQLPKEYIGKVIYELRLFDVKLKLRSKIKRK